MLHPSARRVRWVRPALRFAAAVLVAVAALGAGAQPASAHATLLSVTPADGAVVQRAPAAVELRFDESVEVADSGVRVFAPDGRRVDRGVVDSSEGGTVLRAAFDGNQIGTYTVAWRVLSEDSHKLEGSSIFHVQKKTGAKTLDEEGDPLTGPTGGLARTLAIAALLVTIGAPLVASSSHDVLRFRARRLVLVVGAVGVVAIGGLLVVQAAQASGRSLIDSMSLVLDHATGTRSGRLLLGRGLTLLLAIGLAAAPPVWRRAPWAATVAALGSAFFLAISGHAWTSPHRVLTVVADLVHVAAAGVWIGGLTVLAFGLAGSTDPDASVRRFSAAALAASMLVAVSGTVSAVVQVGSLDALTSTTYGRLVLAKVAGFAALVVLGYWNRARLIPRLTAMLNSLTRSVRIEVGIALAVVMVTAALTNQPPARDAVTQAFSTTVESGPAAMQATLDPARTGLNDLHLYFFDELGQPLPVEAVEVTASTGDIPPRRLDVTPITSTHFSAYGISLPTPGTWVFAVTAVRAGTSTTFAFEKAIT